ncbi:hypothetical protein TL16_g11702 [Triparma laevis f. inornata]|uniref:Uncharacterized protein n=1 Tax=Triparma laevis f. inornata TaxID=1714386 RepID=A0A9W7BGB6_9STRA|nr:hypothetical protein TL16_g11702 [Triparma laevis f. inornata]
MNKFALSLKDIFSGSFTHAIVSNFLISPEHLLNAAPRLKIVPSIRVYGDMSGEEGYATNATNGNMTLYKPKMDKYGSMHSNFALLFYPTGIRVTIFTCNWINEPYLTNGVYVQDFSLKDPCSPPPHPLRSLKKS